MSLANRVALLAVTVLVATGVVMGFAYYAAVRRSLEESHRSALNARIAWLKAVLDVAPKDGSLELQVRDDEFGAEVSWRVATDDGVLLWTSEQSGAPDGEDYTESIEFGAPGAPLVPGCDIRPEDSELRGPLDEKDIPHEVRAAIHAVLPGFVATHIDRDRDSSRRAYYYDIYGIAATREYRFRVTESGSILDHRDRGFIDYEMPEGDRRLRLALTARASRKHVEEELARLATVLCTVGPLILLLAGALLWAVVRHQLRPLGRMAEEAAAIGPGSVDTRIGPVGAGLECVRLRDAINSMVERLGEGLARERRFASTAAHELRGPLAQLRTTVEVALRKEREAGEYREALADTLSDVARLQRLIEGLLQLARTSDVAMPAGRPVALEAVLARIEKDGHPLERADDPGRSEAMVRGEAELLYRAICNVVENAERYAPGAPPTVCLQTGEHRVQLTVSDRGPGVPEVDRERIFEALTRLDDARSIEGPADGFGLGLTVARSTMRAFGGELECRARDDGNNGAQFVFTFVPAPREG